jgi:peptide chain release factor subunit 1
MEERDVATDPVRQVREDETDSPYDLNLRKALVRLAAAPPSTDAPYLTVSLDWRPEGSQPHTRYARQVFAEQMEQIIADYEPHTLAHDSLTADIERISGWLDGQVNPSAHGVFIVACLNTNVFQALSLNIPLETRVVVGPTPALTILGRLAEDYASFAVIHADQHNGSIEFFSQATRERGVSLKGSVYPRNHQQGGFSQQRFQNRAEEKVDAFARAIAEEARKALEDNPVDMIVLAGDETMTSALNDALHQTLQERVIGIAPVDMRANTDELLEAVLPLIAEAERTQEIEAVQRVNDGQGPGGHATAGAEDVLVALQSGQVMTLVMNDDFHGPGWADYTLPVYGVGTPPKNHPAGGEADQIVEVALEDEIVRLAVQTGADIEIVHSSVPVETDGDAPIRKSDDDFPRSEAAQTLDQLGGVAAILRFALSDEQSVAEA